MFIIQFTRHQEKMSFFAQTKKQQHEEKRCDEKKKSKMSKSQFNAVLESHILCQIQSQPFLTS